EGFDVTTRIVNNLLIGRPGTVAMVCSGLFAASSPIMQNNDLWSDGGVAASGLCAPKIGVNSNISVDPRFASPSTGGFALRPGSVAIDAGLDSEPLLPVN